MVVFDYKAIRDVVIKRDFHLVLRVQAEPFPTVDARATKVASRIRKAGVFDGYAAVAPVGQARGELVGALVTCLDGRAAIPTIGA